MMTVKRIFAWLLMIVLLMTGLSASAEPEQVTAVITIDGVRTAFFAENGEYLPPLSENGVLYVPVIPLAESLQIDVTANPETLAVTMNGVRMAFFAADGSLLMPRLSNGQVYVPLAAFAESAGLDLTADGSTYAFRRETAAPQSAQATSLPAAQPPEGSQYTNMPLTTNNYGRYFSISQDYSKPNGNPSPYYITYTATIYATTGYDLINVQFDLKDYGTVRMPASGRATVSYRSESVYSSKYGFTDEDLRKILDLQAAAVLHCALPPSVLAVSGSVRMTRAEAEAINEEDYSNALKGILFASKSLDYIAPIATLERLATMDYKDSAQQARKARQQRDERQAAEKRATQEAEKKKNEQDYQDAEQFLAAQEYDKAIQLLTVLAGKQYKDSAYKLALAQQGKAALEAEQEKADAYQSALDALAAGDYQRAMEQFTALAEAGYRDSADQLTRAQEEKKAAEEKQRTEEENKRREELYRKGLEAETARDTAAAMAAYQELAALDYLDSAEKLSQVKYAAYETAVSAMAKGDYEVAVSHLTPLSQAAYQDSAALLKEARQGAETLERVIALHEEGKGAEGQKLLEANRQQTGLLNAYERWRFRRAYKVTAPNSLGNVWVQYEKAEKGKEVYTLISPVGERLAEVTGDMERSYYTDAGIRITSRQYDSYCNFNYTDYALVTKNKKSFLLDREGNETALSTKYQYSSVASSSLLLFKDGKGRYGYVDFSGKVIVKAAYDSASAFRDGYASITQTDKKGNKQSAVIDETGKIVIPFGTYEIINVINSNLFRALKKDNKKTDYWIDINGKIVQETANMSVFSLDSQYLKNKSNGKTGLIDSHFTQILPCQYNDVEKVIQNQRVIAMVDSSPVLLDMSGKELTVPGQYSSMTAGSDSAAILARGAEDKNWYILDLDGSLLY